jgi:hypothetical protein
MEKLKVDKLKIKRWYLDDCTLGILSYKDFNCFTLELPWLDNKKNISCIPAAGGYLGRKHKSPSNGDCIAIDNVLNRTYIQIHSANYISQLQGCVAVGDSICFINRDGVPDVSNSKNTLKALLEVLPEKFTVEIL